jgi:hypothetical protein
MTTIALAPVPRNGFSRWPTSPTANQVDAHDVVARVDYADGGTGMLDGSPEDDWMVSPGHCNVQVNFP